MITTKGNAHVISARTTFSSLYTSCKKNFYKNIEYENYEIIRGLNQRLIEQD